jgi:hypothetical protein
MSPFWFEALKPGKQSQVKAMLLKMVLAFLKQISANDKHADPSGLSLYPLTH